MSHFGGAVKEADECEFAILGIPYDEKSSYLKGTAKGPAAIRAASTDAMINAWTESGVNLEGDTVIKDLGDLDVTGSYDDVFHKIEGAVLPILESGAVPAILGGDHSISYPVISAAAQHFSPLDVLHFDAHPDLYDELYSDPYSHACPFMRVLEKGLAANLVQVGIRAGTGDHKKTAEEYGVRMISMKDMPPLPELRFENPLYISIDVDSLDPAFAPGVSHLEPGGLSTRDLLRILHSLEARIIGLDVVEVNGSRDDSGITAAAAAKLAMEVMGKIVFDRR